MSNNSNNDFKLQCYVTWKVRNFFDLGFSEHFSLDSPKFQFNGGTWCLRLFPQKHSGCLIDPRVDIWLLRLDSLVPEQSYTSSVGIIKKIGTEHQFENYHKNREFSFKDFQLCGSKFYERRAFIWNNRHIFASDGMLTVYCRVHLKGMSVIGTLPAAKEHTATQTEFELPSCGMEIPSGEKVRCDYKKLLKSGAESDLLVVVSGREFRAHKCILRARSLVFDAMFEHETVEKERGKVVIDYLEPNSFRDFLEFMYTGSVGTLTNKNVFGLYTAADKYNVQELKLEALKYMKSTLCVESFCDVMILALRHQEEELMDFAVIFFKNNMYDILQTMKWQVFMKNNITAANELLIKAVAPEENKSKYVVEKNKNFMTLVKVEDFN